MLDRPLTHLLLAGERSDGRLTLSLVRGVATDNVAEEARREFATISNSGRESSTGSLRMSTDRGHGHLLNLLEVLGYVPQSSTADNVRAGASGRLNDHLKADQSASPAVASFFQRERRV